MTVDVKNMDNMLLIPAGCVLTERHINVFNAWGITEVQVESGGDTEDAGDILKQLPPETLEQLRNELSGIFWDPIDKNVVQAEMFDLVLRRKAKQMAKPRSSPPDEP